MQGFSLLSLYAAREGAYVLKRVVREVELGGNFSQVFPKSLLMVFLVALANFVITISK